jgi:hypothetical protein
MVPAGAFGRHGLIMRKQSTDGNHEITENILEAPLLQDVAKLSGLAQINFADSYEGQVNAREVTANEAAQAIFTAPPRFAVAMMHLRNRIVGLFGLKVLEPVLAARPDPHCIGIFPVLYEAGDTIILGMDDMHLDFRICVRVHNAGHASRITLSTLVGTKNTYGKLYLAAVMPFHRLLSRHMLNLGLQRLAQGSVRNKD